MVHIFLYDFILKYIYRGRKIRVVVVAAAVVVPKRRRTDLLLKKIVSLEKEI
jgi:transcription initiation factor TFIIIB Brf1 subunit/transcription initiation factor TFIIB